MAMLDGYEPVADRVGKFYRRYPEGSIRTKSWEVVEVGGQSFIVVESLVYRSPEDRLPGTGTAWCQFPARNGMLRGAELMRAETASWGRALASIGLGGKQIATSDEVSQVQEKPVVASVSVAAAEFMAWANKEKIRPDKIKLCLGAMGVAMGNKHLKTIVASLTDEQIQTLRGKLV
ncbi:hypothetical protein EBR66_07185 [bacterium]|nr:hypothetical protein [bacterium]